jgi:hypothetical protein
LVLKKDYRSVVLNLTRGKIVNEARKLGWQVGEPEVSMEHDLGLWENLKDTVDFSSIVHNLASDSRCINNSDGKSIQLAYIDSFIEAGFFLNPVNGYDKDIIYGIDDVNKLAKENSLLLLEEWLHVLQYENGDRPVSRRFSHQKDYDPEADVAAYLTEAGVNISGTIFENRYQGVRKK